MLSMEAVAWSLFGLMAAGLGIVVTALWRLSARIDEVRRDLGSRIDGVHADLGRRIDILGGRIDAHLDRHAG